MTFLSYDCALEGNRRAPITVVVDADREAGRKYRVSRRGHRFTLEVDSRRDVYCIYKTAWGRQGLDTARIHVGTNARFH